MIMKLGVGEFSNLGLQYALNHIEDPRYKWLKTEQLHDFNIDNYLTIKIEKHANKYKITIELKHPEYKLGYMYIDDGEQQYCLDDEYRIIIRNNGLNYLRLIALMVGDQDGLLDIELVKEYDLTDL